MLVTTAAACLGMALYFEGRGESLTGQHLIADTIINRVESKRFPGALCDVVLQKKQFSFLNKINKSDDEISELKYDDKKAMARSMKIAKDYLQGTKKVKFTGCNYTAIKINNKWTKKLKVYITEGRHKFMIGGC